MHASHSASINPCGRCSKLNEYNLLITGYTKIASLTFFGNSLVRGPSQSPGWLTAAFKNTQNSSGLDWNESEVRQVIYWVELLLWETSHGGVDLYYLFGSQLYTNWRNILDIKSSQTISVCSIALPLLCQISQAWGQRCWSSQTSSGLLAPYASSLHALLRHWLCCGNPTGQLTCFDLSVTLAYTVHYVVCSKPSTEKDPD